MSDKPGSAILFEVSVEDWMDDALCKGRALGTHDTSSLPNPRSWRHKYIARQLCSGCPVTKACATYALKTWSSGVVVAGVPLKESRNEELYEELREIAEGK